MIGSMRNVFVMCPFVGAFCFLANNASANLIAIKFEGTVTNVISSPSTTDRDAPAEVGDSFEVIYWLDTNTLPGNGNAHALSSSSNVIDIKFFNSSGVTIFPLRLDGSTVIGSSVVFSDSHSLTILDSGPSDAVRLYAEETGGIAPQERFHLTVGAGVTTALGLPSEGSNLFNIDVVNDLVGTVLNRGTDFNSGPFNLNADKYYDDFGSFSGSFEVQGNVLVFQIVPEPATLALLTLGVPWLLRRRN